MNDGSERLTPATPEDLADTLAFALRFDGRKRKHDAAEMMARIVAERVVRYLDDAGFVIMKKPPSGGAVATSASGRVRPSDAQIPMGTPLPNWSRQERRDKIQIHFANAGWGGIHEM